VTEHRRFDVAELVGADDSGEGESLARALEVARALESATDGVRSAPTPELAGRIMAAVAREPAPRPLGVGAALRRRPGPAGLVDSVRVAWRLARSGGRPLRPRLGALAYVAVIAVLAVSLAGAGAYATAGAIGLFAPSASQPPGPTPTSLATPRPLESPEASVVESAEPSESPAASEAEPSDDARASSSEQGGGGGGSGATVRPTASDDSWGDDGGEDGTGSQSPEGGGSPGPSDD
jgi:hypothetical protein